MSMLMTLIVGAKSVEARCASSSRAMASPNLSGRENSDEDLEAARPDVDDRPDRRIDQDVTRRIQSRAERGRELEHGVRGEIGVVQGLGLRVQAASRGGERDDPGR